MNRKAGSKSNRDRQLELLFKKTAASKMLYGILVASLVLQFILIIVHNMSTNRIEFNHDGNNYPPRPLPPDLQLQHLQSLKHALQLPFANMHPHTRSYTCRIG